jgi:hypothetical protein
MNHLTNRMIAAVLAGLLGVFASQAWAEDQPPATAPDQTAAPSADATAASNDGSAANGASANKNVDPGIPPVGNVNQQSQRRNPNGILVPHNTESTYDFLGVGGSGGSGGNSRVGTGVRMKW